MFVLHAGSLSGFDVSCWTTVLSLLPKWPLPGDTPFFPSTLKKNCTLFLTKQMYPATNPERPHKVFFVVVFFPKTLPVMISPEAAEKGFHQREQETMHFKYSAKISEEIDEGGTHSCTKSLLLFRNKQWRLLDALFIPAFALMAYSWRFLAYLNSAVVLNLPSCRIML